MEAQQRQKGFTIIEALVAIAIISLAMVVPLTLSRQSLSAMTRVRNYITATYLAQEGVELVHYLRDSNMIEEEDWLSGIDACYGDGCMIDPSSLTITPCSGACDPMEHDASAGEYSYSGDMETMFTRTIILTPIGSDGEGPYEVEVSSVVTFPFKGRTQQAQLLEHIHRW